MRGEGNRGGAGIDASCVYNTVLTSAPKTLRGLRALRRAARRCAPLRKVVRLVHSDSISFHFVSFSLSLQYEIGVLRRCLYY